MDNLADGYQKISMVPKHLEISRIKDLSPCIIALNNGGSKAPIQLSGWGRSCLAEMGCLG